MDDWKQLIGEAMQIETTDTIAAFKIYERAVFAGLTTAQNLLDDVEAAQIIEAIYENNAAPIRIKKTILVVAMVDCAISRSVCPFKADR